MCVCKRSTSVNKHEKNLSNTICSTRVRVHDVSIAVLHPVDREEISQARANVLALHHGCITFDLNMDEIYIDIYIYIYVYTYIIYI